MCRLRAGIALLALTMLVSDVVRAETVVARRRLGNNAEAMTYDPVNDRAVVMDGNDVIGVALNPFDAINLATMRNDDGGLHGTGYRKLFDVLALPLEAREPKGILYVAAQHRYYFTSDEPGGTGTIFSSDEAGRPRPALVLQSLAQPVDAWEGMAWIPPGAPAHGGTIAALGSRSAESGSHLYFVRPDGTVEQELIPQPGTPLETYFCGVAYQPNHPSTLLLSDCFSGIFAMDLVSGAPIGDQPLFPTPDTPDVEGIVVRNNGSLVLNGYEGRLYAYDRSFRRSAGEDRIFTLGLQVSVFALGWNFETNEFLVLSPVGGHVYSVSAELQTSRRLFDVPVTNEVPNPASITYMGNNEIGVVNAGPPRGIDFAELISSDPNIPNGTSHQRLIWNPADGFPPDGPFNPRGFGMLDSNTIVFRAIGDSSALKVVTRSGRADSSIYRDGVVPDRLPDIMLSSPTDALGVQVFDNGSGPRIFTGAEVYKIDGTLVHRVDWRQLGLSKPARGGVWIGGNTFAALDGLTSTVVIFSMQ